MPARLGAQHWHDRAAEARTVAGPMRGEEFKSGMLKIAAHYEKIAKHAERIERTEAAVANRKNSHMRHSQ
jgi:hypothetical protein